MTQDTEEQRNSKLASADAEGAHVLEETARLEREIQRLQRERSQLAQQLAVVTSSASWRLTAPLRAAAATVRRVLGHPRHEQKAVLPGPAHAGQTIPQPRRVVPRRQVAWDASCPLVSVIVACPHSQDEAQSTLESIKGQTLQDSETIVQVGTSVASWNQGIAQARGKYVCCLVAGDRLEPTYLEKCVIAMEANGGIGFVYPHACVGTTLVESSPFDLHCLMKANVIPRCAVLPRQSWQLVHGLWEDAPDPATAWWDFWLGLALRGARGHLLPERLVLSETSLPAVGSEAAHQIEHRHLRFYRSGDLRQSLQQGYFDTETADAFISLSRPQQFAPTPAEHRVLILTNGLYAGGAETWLHDLICGLSAHSVQTYILTTGDSPSTWHDFFLEATPYIYHLSPLMPRGCWVDFIANLVRTRGIQTIAISLSAWTYRHLPSLRQTLPGVRIINVLHSDFDPGYFQDSVACDPYVDLHVAVASYIKDRMCAIYSISPGKVTVVCNGVDVERRYNPDRYDPEQERRRWDIPPRTRVLTWIGRLGEEKRPQHVVDTAMRLKGRNVLFVIAGGGLMADQLQQTIARADVQGQVKMLGPVTADQVPGILSLSDVLILTSSFEGGPRVVLEALAMGVPVVSYEVGNVRDIIQNGVNGFWVEQNRVDLLVDRVVALLDDAALLARCKANARPTIVGSRYTTEHMVHEWRRVLLGQAAA